MAPQSSDPSDGFSPALGGARAPAPEPGPAAQEPAAEAPAPEAAPPDGRFEVSFSFDFNLERVFDWSWSSDRKRG